MNNVKRKNRSNFVRVLVCTLTGMSLWLLIAGIMSWIISSDYLNESSAVAVAPVAQGVIAYIITILAYVGMSREGLALPLLAPGIYLVLQIVIALLFWRVDAAGVIRGCAAGACGVILAVITCKTKRGRGKRKGAFRKRSR